ncbi:hypothetical protein PR048_022085 [Dryococelus australis]|uniref:RNA helicase n=1 Tax=Dryococelus australis TaxID=614101 RepID=A0ABQ9H042_9NEOP|nr:hypothetical protein PR048_022085 [Dryococelus australis]
MKGRRRWRRPRNKSLSAARASGDWLQLEAVVAVDEEVADVSGEILSIDSLMPLRSRVVEAAVTRLFGDGSGLIDQEIFFSPEVCEVGYKPCVSDRVACQAIESDQQNVVWRAISVVCLVRANKTVDVPCKKNSGEISTENNNGIVITPSDELIVLNMGETKEVTLQLENKGSCKQFLLRSFFASKRFDSQLRIKYPNCNDRCEINPGQGVKYVFLSRGMFIGESMEKFVFVFKGFSISYEFWFEIKDKLTKTVENYSRPYNRKMDARSLQRNSLRNMLDVIPGVRPCKPPAFRNVSLGLFPVPDQLWNVMLGEDEVPNSKSEILKRLQNVRPCLITDLNFDNYSDRFHALLYVEEIDATVKLRRYDMERANFQFAGPGGQYLSLEVPGLAEKRPSVIMGDCIHAETLLDDIAGKAVLAAPYQPPRSLDLNPLGFYLWGHLKAIVYATRVDYVDILRGRIVAGCETIRNTPEMHQCIRESMQRQVEACLCADGGHLNLLALVQEILGKYHASDISPKHAGQPGPSPAPLHLIERHFPEAIPPTEKKQKPTRQCGMGYALFNVFSFSYGHLRGMEIDFKVSFMIHAGYVHQIYKQHVWLKFDSNFHSSYDMSDYRVSFQFNRTPIRRCHAAINDALSHLRAAFLFPTQVKPQPPQVILEPEDDDDELKENQAPVIGGNTTSNGCIKPPSAFGQLVNLSERDFKKRKLFWFNKHLNCYQKEAVRNILRGEARPLPYIIFGPPGTGKTITLVETVLQILHLMPYSSGNIDYLNLTPSGETRDEQRPYLLTVDGRQWCFPYTAL